MGFEQALKKWMGLALIIGNGGVGCSHVSVPTVAPARAPSESRTQFIFEEAPTPATRVPLSVFAPSSVRMRQEFPANSEQRAPVLLSRFNPESSRPQVPAYMKSLVSAQAKRIARVLKQKEFELELWPTSSDDDARWSWFFARWRKSSQEDWQWLNTTAMEKPLQAALDEGEPPPLFPEWKYPSREKDFSELFDDFMSYSDLYEKPRFGDSIWATRDGRQIYSAWENVDTRASQRTHWLRSRDQLQDTAAILVQQPSRMKVGLKNEAITLVLRVNPSGVRFQTPVEWVKAIAPVQSRATPRRLKWDTQFAEAYREDVTVIAGQKPAQFPISGRVKTFTKKNSATKNNDLEALVDYLEERYRALGIKTDRHRFEWRGIPQSNLIAVIPGSLPPELNHPVLLGDHIDTAFSEDLFKPRRRIRQSTHGADDNVTAVGVLLRAAETIQQNGIKPLHDLWLVHETGEEFPGDSLGARALVQKWRAEGRELGVMIQLDMIGWNPERNRVFQINAGASLASVELASRAQAIAREVAPGLKAVIRDRWDPKSYLFNTDGIVYDETQITRGVILINERINLRENFDHSGYHQTSDVVANIDWDYAVAIAQVAIQTAVDAALGTHSR